MDEREFKRLTKKPGLDVIRLVESLPRKRAADVIGRQLLRAATSVGANYRSAWRGRSPADVVAKLAIVEEEADETCYWLGMLEESGIVSSSVVSGLRAQADGIVAMTVASIRTMRGKYFSCATARAMSAGTASESKIRNPKSKMPSERRAPL